MAGMAMWDLLLTSAEKHCRRTVGEDLASKVPGNFLEGGKKAPSIRVSWRVSAAERTDRKR